MSPLGGGRSFSSQSPSLARRVALQHLPPAGQDLAPCHKNIWPNPLQTLPGESKTSLRLGTGPDTLPTGQQDLYIHSHSFPHIPKNQLQLSESPGPHRTDIYENPSEHYASIGHYAVAPGPTPRTAGPNFYGYGMLEKPKL
jgi:hypothetical protein